MVSFRVSSRTHANSHSAQSQKPTLIVPDKDADGLSSGVIIHRTLLKLGLSPEFLDVHLVQKGSNIHEEYERKLMLEKKPSFIIVLDQGSRGGPPVVDDRDVQSLIIDHHLSDDFPESAIVSSPFIWRYLLTRTGSISMPLPTSSNDISYYV